MESIQAEMAAIRATLGSKEVSRQFYESLKKDPRFIAQNAEELEELYQRCLNAIEPRISDYFSTLPNAPYGVKRVDPANEAGLTFGFFQAPTPTEPRGLYRYNGADLSEKPTLKACPLIYHELVPGHHFQIVLQQENERLPDIRRFAGGLYLSAYIEGWAEYASILGYEMGLYDDVFVRYGRLSMDASAAARMVVDTGLNGLGWPLEKARQYLRENTLLSEAEIETETLRYSTDIPGQALAYAIGPLKIREFRSQAEGELDEKFDAHAFHAAVLIPGPLPLDVLERHIADWVDERR